MQDIIENKATAPRWIPLPLDYVLEKYNLASSKVLVLLLLWIFVIGTSIASVLWISPSEFMLLDSGQTSINNFFLFYPPLILGTLLLFWVGFEWGFIPLFLSGFIITFTASVTYYWGLLFGIAFVLGLGIYALAYYCAPFDPGLRDFKSFVFFTVVSFFAAIASSLGSFVWSDFFELSAFETILLWKGWWTGMFLQSMLIVAPILYLFTPWISSLRNHVFPETPKPNVTLGWIYSAIGSVAVVLVLFIIGAKVLGTEGLTQQLAALDPSISKNLVQTNESLELISWISIGLVLSLGSGSIYLVGSWNKNLQQQVTLKTEQLTESQKRLKKALNEQDLLLSMIHHRVRDNLTIVLALLELQLKNETEKPTSELLKDSHARIRSMALIHETMVQSESISEVNMKNFAIKLSNRLQKSFQNKQQDVEVSMNVDEILMHIDRAVPVAMILNELMVNAFMHGFTDLPKGVVFVYSRKKGNNLYFKVRNNGHPLPPDFENIIKRTLGYKLIKTLVKQLDGEYKIIDGKEPTIEVIVPVA
ncbi:MAG TPA: sensor histidine kinase [Balneolaceae bacterium]|nr:sensor histidine kinase [Balneolaceae bacterium]